jgi:hypothetical protein
MSLFRDSSGNQYNSDTQDIRQDFLGRYVYSPPSMGDSSDASIYVFPVDVPTFDITKPGPDDPPKPDGPYGLPNSPWPGQIIGYWSWEWVGLDDYRGNRNGYAWVAYNNDAYQAWYNAAYPPRSGNIFSSILPTILGALSGGAVLGVTGATALGNVETGQAITEHLQSTLVIDAIGAAATGIAAITAANGVAAETAVTNAVATEPVAIVEALPSGLAPVAGEAATSGEIVSSIGSTVIGGVKSVGAVVGGVTAIERVINPPKPPVPIPPHPADSTVISSPTNAAPQVGGIDLVLLALFAKVIL